MNLCPSCSATLKPKKKYCNFNCYSEALKKQNYDNSNFVIAEGITMPITAAVKKYNTNHYAIVRDILIENKGLFKVLDKEQFIKEELARLKKKNPDLPSKETVQEWKNNKAPLKDLSKSLGITYNALRYLCDLYNISTCYDQIDPLVLNSISKEYLSEKLKKNWSAEKISKEFSVSPTTILTKIHEFGLTISPSFVSTGETEVKEFIESLGLECRKYKTQKYEIDIFIPEMKLGIEYNGVYWHSKYKESYHFDKYLMCKEDGIRLIQLWDLQWLTQESLIKQKLMHILGKAGGERIFARNCTPVILKNAAAKTFYEANHIQGHRYVKTHYGLNDKYNNLVAAMSFSGNKLERFSTSQPVVGGFSKLLSFAIKELELKEIFTFADLFWSDHEENQYVKNGFEFVHFSPPSSFWCKNERMFSRMKFQKHRLKNMAGFDIAKSSKEILEQNGYFCVFNAGHAKFKLKIKK